MADEITPKEEVAVEAPIEPVSEPIQVPEPQTDQIPVSEPLPTPTTEAEPVVETIPAETKPMETTPEELPPFASLPEEKPLASSESVTEEVKPENWDSRECIMCGKEIGIDRKRYADGKLFHKKCFKKAVSMVMNGQSKMISQPNV